MFRAASNYIVVLMIVFAGDSLTRSLCWPRECRAISFLYLYILYLPVIGSECYNFEEHVYHLNQRK